MPVASNLQKVGGLAVVFWMLFLVGGQRPRRFIKENQSQLVVESVLFIGGMVSLNGRFVGS